MQELADLGLIQEPFKVDQVDFLGVNLTAEGRRAVRSNFKRESIAPVQQIGAIFQKPVSQNRIQERGPQLLLNPIFRGRGFHVEDDLCFVLMPFAPEDLQTVYQDFVKPTVERAGLRCVRADDIFGASAIIEDIWAAISRARFVIAEFTGRNPNVFYEIGICHTVGKDVIFLAQSVEDIPFDLRHLRVLLYDYTPRGCQRLAEALYKTILAVTGRSVEPTA